MAPMTHNRLTVIVKRCIDVFWYLCLFFVVVWPLMVLVVGLHLSSAADQNRADVEIFSSFRITADFPAQQATADSKEAGLLVSGRGKLRLNDTNSRLGWYLSGAISEVMVLISIFGLLAMRRLFTSLSEGKTFAKENSGHVRRIGYVVVAWNIISPLLQYFGSRVMLNDIALNVPGIHLYPSFELNIDGIIAGLAMLVLSGVLREAAILHDEQSLTI